ncbi:peptidase family S64-domain-containing protein [Lipomyces oligophaga]|uniref:peptidase family S64-domain-containing protein n=1 Tax=Lipomyces oligophaga TaxID=45792 RepID=UPI0034CD29CC
MNNQPAHASQNEHVEHAQQGQQPSLSLVSQGNTISRLQTEAETYPISPLSRPAPWSDSEFAYGAQSTSEYRPRIDSVYSPSSSGSRSSIGLPFPHRPSDPRSNSLAVIAESQRSLNADLDDLAKDCKDILKHVSKRDLDLSKAAATLTEYMRILIRNCSHHNIPALQPSPINNSALSLILKVVLHFADNLLVGLPYASARSVLLRAASDLGVKLKLVPVYTADSAPPQPRNFALSEAYMKPEAATASTIEHVNKLMDILPKHQVMAVQDGAFIAPIARGLSESFAVVSVLFGMPTPTETDYDSVSSLWDVADDIHFFCQRNRIQVAAGNGSTEASAQPRTRVAMGGFRRPFRDCASNAIPPMSMSIASEDAESLSGTLGGYVYPKVDPNDTSLAAYSQSSFAMTCAHVCLTESRVQRPPVCVPSPVLVNMYRNALLKEYAKYPSGSDERRAFKRFVHALDDDYPRQNGRSFPAKFGDVLWGERTLCNGMISDVAVVRCRPGLKPQENILGDDVPFAEYDPSLMFTNLSVRRVVKRLVPGLDVFKYGSTSKFTTGKLNGPRLIYWADGALQSSEFVVAASGSGMFASGGDSGAWILRKEGISGLGVIGMLHAYDGEHREFGLFTPMTRILERLREVTGIEWGVVGAKESDSGEQDDMMVGGSETSDSSHGNDDSNLDSSSDSDLE